MHIYHVLTNTLSAQMIHINLNMAFYTHVEHSPTKTVYIKYYMEKQTSTHTPHTHTHYQTQIHGFSKRNKKKLGEYSLWWWVRCHMDLIRVGDWRHSTHMLVNNWKVRETSAMSRETSPRTRCLHNVYSVHLHRKSRHANSNTSPNFVFHWGKGGYK